MRQPDKKPSEESVRKVLMCLSEHIVTYGTINASLDTVGKSAGCCKRTAYRALAELEHNGYIERWAIRITPKGYRKIIRMLKEEGRASKAEEAATGNTK